MKTALYTHSGLMGIEDILKPLSSEGGGMKVDLYHHISISDTVLTVVAAGLATFLLAAMLKFKKKT
jgi:hypothetical protein